jgi:CheY-like chemotaxis protein
MTSKNLCKSILIAEDNEDIRDTIEETLKSAGYEVKPAVD